MRACVGRSPASPAVCPARRSPSVADVDEPPPKNRLRTGRGERAEAPPTLPPPRTGERKGERRDRRPFFEPARDVAGARPARQPPGPGRRDAALTVQRSRRGGGRAGGGRRTAAPARGSPSPSLSPAPTARSRHGPASVPRGAPHLGRRERQAPRRRRLPALHRWRGTEGGRAVPAARPVARGFNPLLSTAAPPRPAACRPPPSPIQSPSAAYCNGPTSGPASPPHARLPPPPAGSPPPALTYPRVPGSRGQGPAPGDREAPRPCRGLPRPAPASRAPRPWPRQVPCLRPAGATVEGPHALRRGTRGTAAPAPVAKGPTRRASDRAPEGRPPAPAGPGPGGAGAGATYPAATVGARLRLWRPGRFARPWAGPRAGPGRPRGRRGTNPLRPAPDAKVTPRASRSPWGEAYYSALKIEISRGRPLPLGLVQQSKPQR